MEAEGPSGTAAGQENVVENEGWWKKQLDQLVSFGADLVAGRSAGTGEVRGGFARLAVERSFSLAAPVAGQRDAKS